MASTFTQFLNDDAIPQREGGISISSREIWQMCWALSQLETERGNESAAVQLKEQARYETLWITEHVGTPELRDVFLSRLDVQLILGAS